MAERPGIILYFDMVAPLKRLGYEDKGKLLEAMLEYGQYGVVPELDGVLPFIWDCIQPKLDADAKRYRKTVFQKTYSSYCAKEKKNGNNAPLDFEEWCAREGIDTTEWIRVVSTDIERYPNTTPNPEITPKANTMTEAKADGGGKGEEVPQNETEEQRRQRMIALLGNYHPN